MSWVKKTVGPRRRLPTKLLVGDQGREAVAQNVEGRLIGQKHNFGNTLSNSGNQKRAKRAFGIGCVKGRLM